MATTTVGLTVTSSDLTSDSISLSSTMTLTKAGTSTGLDQTTGLASRYFSGITAATTLFTAASYTDNKSHKIYVKNTSTSDTDAIEIQVSPTAIGKLYGGDWAFFPWNGDADFKVATEASGITVEFMLIYEA